MKEKVFVTREIPSEGLDIIRSNFETTVWQPEVPPTRDEIVEKAKGCAGLVTLLTDPIDSLLIQQKPFSSLLIICSKLILVVPVP